ncbi:MAG: S-adenosylmethionine:tRNA ribosyltransferase-isomerase, partial [Jatrophihabitantaceae bacterium]
PPERDAVRLLVADPDRVRHERFVDFARCLTPGDLLVVNTSATLAAEVDGTRADGTAVLVHFSTRLEDGSWVVELRPPWPSVGPLPDVRRYECVELPDGIRVCLIDAHPGGQSRMWRAAIAVDGGVPRYLARHGRPIRYAYVPDRYPLADYQTVFADEPGSAEMPSAGRPFTTRIVTDLAVRGVAVAPITLHTGVSSQEPGEPPQAERYRVPTSTARLVNATRHAGGRIVAVGTTVTRALESAATDDGTVHASGGWTDLVLGPDRPARVVTGLVTGWHAPGASHLFLLQAVAGAELVDAAYTEALREQYRWHEFGDSCLLLPLR